MRALRRRQYYQTFDFYFVLQLAATEITTYHIWDVYFLSDTPEQTRLTQQSFLGIKVIIITVKFSSPELLLLEPICTKTNLLVHSCTPCAPKYICM